MVLILPQYTKNGTSLPKRVAVVSSIFIVCDKSEFGWYNKWINDWTDIKKNLILGGVTKICPFIPVLVKTRQIWALGIKTYTHFCPASFDAITQTSVTAGEKKKKKKKLAVRIQITSTCSFYCYSKAVGTARADCSTESVSRASVVVIMTADGNRKWHIRLKVSMLYRKCIFLKCKTQGLSH